MPQVYSLDLIFSWAEMENKTQTPAEVKTDIVNKTLARKEIFFLHSLLSLSSAPLTHQLLLAACCVYILSLGGK